MLTNGEMERLHMLINLNDNNGSGQADVTVHPKTRENKTRRC